MTKGSTGKGFNYVNSTGSYGYTPWYTSRTYGGATSGGASTTSVGENSLKVTIDDGITRIGDNMFYNCYRIQLESPIDGITIGNNAFTNSGVNL